MMSDHFVLALIFFLIIFLFYIAVNNLLMKLPYLAGPSSAFSLSSEPELLDSAELAFALLADAFCAKLAFLEAWLLPYGCTLLILSRSKREACPKRAPSGVGPVTELI